MGSGLLSPSGMEEKIRSSGYPLSKRTLILKSKLLLELRMRQQDYSVDQAIHRASLMCVRMMRMITQGNKFYTQKPDPTCLKVFGAQNPNLTSEMLHYVTFSRYSNLEVLKTRFFAIFEVILYSKIIFFLKTNQAI